MKSTRTRLFWGLTLAVTTAFAAVVYFAVVRLNRHNVNDLTFYQVAPVEALRAYSVMGIAAILAVYSVLRILLPSGVLPFIATRRTLLARTAILLFVACVVFVLTRRIYYSRWLAAHLSTPALISRLADISEEGVGFHSTAWAWGFVADQSDPQFGGGVMGSELPHESPVMVELVSRGVEAIPFLISHLTDARPSGLILNPMAGGMWFDGRYYRRDTNLPPIVVTTETIAGTNALREWCYTRFARDGGYRVRIGDLCYVALGQILCSSMDICQYVPSGNLSIFSPVEYPPIAQAVSNDWWGLTTEAHLQMLRNADAAITTNRFIPVSIPRIMLEFYYPERI